MGGARIDFIQKTNSARPGQLNGSELSENISAIAAAHCDVGIMIAINSDGELLPPSTSALVDSVIGMSIEDYEAGDYSANLIVNNQGKPVALNVFGGAWVQAEDVIGIGKSPYIRFTTGAGGTVIGAVRSDADTTTAKQNTNFTVRRMSADKKAALVIPAKMHI